MGVVSVWLAALVLLLPGSFAAFAADAGGPGCVLIEQQGKVEIARKGSADWASATTNEVLQVGDRLRTGLRARATLRWSDLSVLRVNQLTSMEISPPEKVDGKPKLDLKSGATYLFSREKPSEIQFQTPVASGAIRGTEFNLAVAEDGRTELALLDGEVDLKNGQGGVTLKGGEQGSAEQGKAPVKTAMLDAMNTIQWALYYPAVVDPDELGQGQAEKEALGGAAQAYRQGDLLGALKKYPANREPASEGERVFHAALLLSVGQVEQAEADLGRDKCVSGPANALRELIAVVKGRTPENLSTPASASENMARSYTLQARSQLKEALAAAREATQKSPAFGAAWIRVAELEFGFGHTAAALTALNKGLELSPGNAQGLALNGFLLSARGKTAQAMASFEKAIAADGALGNAWLGRGLLKIHSGDLKAGREDLQVAATLEPQRAVLRSYLGKAFAVDNDKVHAQKELTLAKKLDPNDPTSWLYSALLLQQENRVNEATRDLEESKELNDNRSVFRSRLLLDQDQAVRSANLAAIYRDAGMFDVSVQEASAAVNSDYANASAHQFLASSYDYIRDPKLINLRFETAAYSEYLLANLLAPAGGGGLAQTISQQEYSRFFVADHLGAFGNAEYSSHGDWIVDGGQYGVIGDTSYALSGSYRNELGYRPNNDLELWTLSAQVKEQLTPQDSLYLEVSTLSSRSGDLAQYYSQSSASQTVRVSEKQTPNVLLGYHHEWAPGSHTLFFAGRYDDTLEISDTDYRPLFLRTQRSFFSTNTTTTVTRPPFYSLDYERELEAYSAELQQVWQSSVNTLIVGSRFQTGDLQTESGLTRNFVTTTPITTQDVSSDLNRFSIYAYDYWRIINPLQITAGVSYDRLHYPQNIDTSPITSSETTTDRVSPKAGILWTPWKDTEFRGVYTRSLGGFSLDQSVRMEPTQIAGFNQAFRSLIPESVAGLVPGTRFETFGLGWNQKFKTGTYITLDGQLLNSDATRTVGMLTNSSLFGPIANSPTSTRQSLDYQEKSLSLALNQLIGAGFSLGARYRLTHADLTSQFVDLAPTIPGVPNSDVSALLHQVWLYGIYNHRSGFFAQADAVWSLQENHGYSGTEPGDNFWQVNLHAGYRFWDRRAELRLSLMNVTDQDYRLNPLTLYNELPRERALVVGFKFFF